MKHFAAPLPPMASPLVSRAPQCLSCVRRIYNTLYEITPAYQQVRGKKRLARVPKSVKVHLLQNVPGYGRRGAIIPVTSGMMRNIWYPKQMAEYLTAAKVEELHLRKDMPVEREYTFKSKVARKAERRIQYKEQEEKEEALSQLELESEFDVKILEDQREPVPQIELDLLGPNQATTILDQLLPSFLEFYRTPIDTPASAPRRVSPSIPARSSVSVAVGRDSKPEKTRIHGSVSTSDIAANLKAILAEDEDGMRVVGLLKPEDISFVEETEDKDRVKHLGVFEIEIHLEGAADSVPRTIKVSAQG